MFESAVADDIGSHEERFIDREVDTPPFAYPAHHFAEIFPLRAGKPLADLAQNMKEHGQKEDVVLLDGKILDGRRRQMAAIKAGITPRYREFGSRPSDGANPLEFAFSVNFHRRDDLTVAEKALAAMAYANCKKGMNQHSRADVPLISQSQAAEAFGVNKQHVRRVNVVAKLGTPELLEAVRSEEVTISDAAAVAKLPAEVQGKALKAVREGQASTLKNAIACDKPEQAAKVDKFSSDLDALIKLLGELKADRSADQMALVQASESLRTARLLIRPIIGRLKR